MFCVVGIAREFSQVVTLMRIDKRIEWQKRMTQNEKTRIRWIIGTREMYDTMKEENKMKNCPVKKERQVKKRLYSKIDMIIHVWDNHTLNNIVPPVNCQDFTASRKSRRNLFLGAPPFFGWFFEVGLSTTKNIQLAKKSKSIFRIPICVGRLFYFFHTHGL